VSLVLGLLVLGAGAITVWGGITDPEGGVFAGLRNAIEGAPNLKHAATAPAAFLTDMAAVAGGQAGGQAPGAPSPASGARAGIVATARSWLGVPYHWAGTTRTGGVDCSGLVMNVYATAGIRMPHLAAAQQAFGRRVSAAAAQPGDLVFFGIPASHVGIYLGGGQLLHAPHTGAVVRVESVASVAASLPGSPVTYRDVLDGRRRKPAADTGAARDNIGGSTHHHKPGVSV
jgi:cell wall-associated NlpC family hydrolase